MEDKNSAFMPGCSLPSYNPEAIETVVSHLKEVYDPSIGAVQKCCGKPTKALGQYDLFKERYHSLEEDFEYVGADEVIVACQNCFNMIKEYSPERKVTSAWALFPKIGLPEHLKGIGKDSDIVFSIHDSCPTRYEPEIHDGIRWMLDEMGYKWVDPPHARENSLCCGFGGMIMPVNPDVGQRVASKRCAEIETDWVLTYCAACRNSMVRGGKKALHMFDLIATKGYPKGKTWMNSDEMPLDSLSNPIKSWQYRRKSKKLLNRTIK